MPGMHVLAPIGRICSRRSGSSPRCSSWSTAPRNCSASPISSGLSNLPPFTLFWIAGVIEIVGGLLLIAGLWTRPVAFLLSGEMAIAYFMEHQPIALFPINNQGDAPILLRFVSPIRPPPDLAPSRSTTVRLAPVLQPAARIAARTASASAGPLIATDFVPRSTLTSASGAAARAALPMVAAQ